MVTLKTLLVTQNLLLKLKLLLAIGNLAECSACGRKDKRLHCATQSLIPATIRLHKDVSPLFESLRALRIAVQGSGKADSRRSAWPTAGFMWSISNLLSYAKNYSASIQMSMYLP